MIEFLKRTYYEFINTVFAHEESDTPFLRFLDTLYNVLVVFFIMFGAISIYFFMTREVL